MSGACLHEFIIVTLKFVFLCVNYYDDTSYNGETDSGENTTQTVLDIRKKCEKKLASHDVLVKRKSVGFYILLLSEVVLLELSSGANLVILSGERFVKDMLM